jgi:hypothetical protein
VGVRLASVVRERPEERVADRGYPTCRVGGEVVATRELGDARAGTRRAGGRGDDRVLDDGAGARLEPPEPLPALLPAIVALCRASTPAAEKIPPPFPVVELPLIVEFVIPTNLAGSLLLLW